MEWSKIKKIYERVKLKKKSVNSKKKSVKFKKKQNSQTKSNHPQKTTSSHTLPWIPPTLMHTKTPLTMLGMHPIFITPPPTKPQKPPGQSPPPGASKQGRCRGFLSTRRQRTHWETRWGWMQSKLRWTVKQGRQSSPSSLPSSPHLFQQGRHFTQFSCPPLQHRAPFFSPSNRHTTTNLPWSPLPFASYLAW